MAQAQTITVIDPADFHVHLRQAHTSKLVTPHVKKGGFNLAYVMVSPAALLARGRLSDALALQPNTVPAITTPAQAAGYLAELRKLAPETQFLMTLYLTDKLTPQHIREASGIGIRGVKSYPRGVTTNSDGGVGMEGYAKFDDVFAEMEKVGMVLNLHGEVPSDPNGDGTCVLNAEERFLPHLHEIHRKFPNLKIVLEHVTTSAAVEAVSRRSRASAAHVLRRDSRLAGQVDRLAKRGGDHHASPSGADHRPSRRLIAVILQAGGKVPNRPTGVA